MSSITKLPGWVGFDLDGTLAEYHGWVSVHNIGSPIEPMIQILFDHIVIGNDCRIFTARIYREIELLSSPFLTDTRKKELITEIHQTKIAIKQWLYKLGLPNLPVTCIKDMSMSLLYDDRCRQVETNTGKIATFV